MKNCDHVSDRHIILGSASVRKILGPQKVARPMH